MVSAMRLPPSTLMAPQPVSFITRAADSEGLLLRGFIGTERHVDHHQRAARAAHHRVALQDHHVERDRDRGLEPVHHHAERIADQDEVAMAVEHARGVGVIGGQRDDRLAALAGADIRRGQAFLLGLYRHVRVPSAGVPNAGTPMTRVDETRARRASRGSCRPRPRSSRCAARRPELAARRDHGRRLSEIRSYTAQASIDAEQDDRAEIAVGRSGAPPPTASRRPASDA